MFLGGKFRRIINIETRTAVFDASLTKPINLEDCWAAIRAGSQSFGFHEVRMSLCGRLFEDACSGPAKPRWPVEPTRAQGFRRRGATRTGAEDDFNPNAAWV